MKRLLKKVQASKMFMAFCAALFVLAGLSSAGLGDLISTGSSLTLMQTNTAEAADMLGVINQTKTTTTGPTTCSGTNYITGGTVTQPAAGTGDRRYCYGMYSCNPSVPSSCINPVTGQQMSAGYTCRVGMYETGVSGLAQRALPLNVTDCARQGVEWRFSQPQGGLRMPNIGAYIDKNGCYVKYTWSSGTAKATGVGDGQLVCPTSTTDGSFVPALSNSGDAALLAGTAAGTSGQSSSTNSAAGFVESAANGRLQGWALSVTNLAQSVKVRVYHKPLGSVSATFLGEFSADVSRPDLVNVLKLPTGSSDRHGFDVQLPASVQNGDTVLVYAVVGAWNPLIGEVVVGSASQTTPASYNGIASGTAGFIPGVGTVGKPTEVQITNPQSWDNWVAGCNALGTQVCLVPIAGGGTQCAATAKGLTAEEYDLCKDRFDACGVGRSGKITGFCDPGRYTECREAGGEFVDWAGRINTDACDRFLLDNGCEAGNATTCRPECILPGGERPADCGGTPPPSGDDTNSCVDSRGMPIRCNTPPPPAEDCVDSRGMPIRCGSEVTPPPPSTGTPAGPPDQTFGPAPTR